MTETVWAASPEALPEGAMPGLELAVSYTRGEMCLAAAEQTGFQSGIAQFKDDESEGDDIADFIASLDIPGEIGRFAAAVFGIDLAEDPRREGISFEFQRADGTRHPFHVIDAGYQLNGVSVRFLRPSFAPKLRLFGGRYLIPR